MPPINPPVLSRLLGTLGNRMAVEALDVCESTSSLLLKRAEAGFASNVVLVTDIQTAGRGRQGRSWLSSPEDSLTFSLLWQWDAPLSRLSGLSLGLGLALLRALESFGANGLALKWPNDLMFGQKQAKLAGILIETMQNRSVSPDSAALSVQWQLVIGVGLNLRVPPLPEFSEITAAGLADCCPRLPERHELLAVLLKEMAAVLDQFALQGFPPFKQAWQSRHIWQDQPVCLLEAGSLLAKGVCRGVNDEGALLLETQAGLETFLSGDLSLRVRKDFS